MSLYPISRSFSRPWRIFLGWFSIPRFVTLRVMYLFAATRCSNNSICSNQLLSSLGFLAQEKSLVAFFAIPYIQHGSKGHSSEYQLRVKLERKKKIQCCGSAGVKLPWEWPICNNNTRLFSSFKLIQRFCSAPLRLAQITHVFKAKAHYRSHVFIYYTAYKSVADLVL